MIKLDRIYLQFVSDVVFDQYLGVEKHPKLLEFTRWFLGKYGYGVVTSGWRPDKIHASDSGIHTFLPLRATDWRYYVYGRSGADVWKVAKAMERHINATWQYDYKRPHLNVAILHDTGLGKHFHTQVHDNTRRR